MNEQELARFKQELRHYTSSEQFIKNMFGGVYTEGVYFMAETLGAYWLVDFIFIHQRERALQQEQFQVWKIILTVDGGATINVEDGNDNPVFSKDIPFTDFQLSEFTLWFVAGTLMLPSEY